MLDEFRSTLITWDKATSRIYSPVTANASDSNGRKLNIQVVNSGQVENLTGATLHLYWETKDKTQHGLDAFTASDISKGEFEIFYTTGMLSNVGELNATLVLVDSTGKVVSDWFKITVTRGINEGAIQSENSFSSLTQALIDISNLEQNYAPRLNDLTAQLQQTENNINETEFVEYIKNNQSYQKMTLEVTNNANVKEFNINLINEAMRVRYRFRKGSVDDYIYLSGVTKKEYDVALNHTAFPYSSFLQTGSWTNSGAGKIEYTTTQGSILSQNFTTQHVSRVYSDFYTENRGGQFKVTIDNLEPIVISIYNGGTPRVRRFLLFDNVESGEHTITYEFIGDDPANPPSGGTSRGWVMIAESDFLVIEERTQTEQPEIELMSSGSIKEFAFSMKPENTNTNVWFPQHGSTGTVYNKDEPLLIMNGVPYSFDDLGQNLEYNINSFQFVQNLYGRHPETNNLNLFSMLLTHSIDLDGVMSVSGDMEVLEPLIFNLSYVLMTPVNNTIFNKLVTGIGNSYPCVKTDGSQTTLTENKNCKNYMFTGGKNLVGFKHSDIRNNLIYESPNLSKYDNFIDHRDSDLVKHYINVFDSSKVVEKDFKYKWQGEFAVGSFLNIYS